MQQTIVIVNPIHHPLTNLGLNQFNLEYVSILKTKQNTPKLQVSARFYYG